MCKPETPKDPKPLHINPIRLCMQLAPQSLALADVKWLD